MPFPFSLPTTSAFSFSSALRCDSHPSLPLHASTQRGVVRESLAQHKRLAGSLRSGHLATVQASLNGYIPYLLAVDAGVSAHALVGGEVVNVVLKTAPQIRWRPRLGDDVVAGHGATSVKVESLEYEIAFVLMTLGFVHVATARATLQPLHVTTGDFVPAAERTRAVQTAGKLLLDAASVFEHVATRSESLEGQAPCVDVAPAMARALAALCLAEATLLAVTKDDGYPAAVAQDRNKTDKEWMFKAPELSKVKAHLNARLCLAASDHAAQAAALCLAPMSGGRRKVTSALTHYIDDLRKTCRAKACRFFGVHAEVDGNVAEGIGWLRCAFQALGVEPKDQAAKRGLSLSRLKKGLLEKREDRRVEKETDWGVDAGRLEELRILEMLDAKWTKMNDTMNTQVIPSANSLLAKMPSGREICSIKPYQPPILDRQVLDAMRAPPDGDDDDGVVSAMSSDDEPSMSVGGYPADYASVNGGAYY
ncbi:hypothetical protein CDD81_6034 [Ophiocordyceps australis]|uniref:pH-response regulator protein palC n=1 Tax=Ophiocordyceps australis TaxID=1399860 RepID=A0A2C5Y3Q8_9HYPO|nr:hypothetical protein CDD81_6034 [Ophiocordyceps australis]